MNCKKIKKQLPDYVANALSEEQHQEMKEHLARCASCERERSAWAVFMKNIKRAEAADPGDRFWLDFTARVTAVIERERQASPWSITPTWLTFPSPLPAFRMAMLGAIAVTVVVGFSFFFNKGKEGPTASLTLEQVVRQADLEDTEGTTVLFAMIEDRGDDLYGDGIMEISYPDD